MANKNIIIHPIVNGVEDTSINLFPLTNKQNILGFDVQVGDINSGVAVNGAILVADGNGGAAWVNIGNANSNIAANYEEKAYAVGDYCIYNNTLYRCTTAIVSGEAWNSAHWTMVTIGDQLKTKQDVIDSTHKLNADLVDDTNADHKFVTAADKVAWNAKQNAIDSTHKLDADLVDDSTSDNKFVTTSEKSTWSAKQDALDTQTAYTAKGSATKVPQITTNALGQVTEITEVTIDQPTVNDATLTIKAGGTTKGTFSANASSNVEVNITAADLGLSSALRFLGNAQTTVPVSGNYVQTSINSTTYYVPVTDSGAATEIAAQKGDVIVIGTKEYVCNTAGLHAANAFEELGDESSFALKTTTISVGTGLTGGGTLEANRTISLADNYGDTKNPYAAKGANTVLAGPASGENAAPAFRALVSDDIPNLNASKITDGTFADARIASASTWNAKYDKPSGGIPDTDLSTGVQASLGKADTAVQPSDLSFTFSQVYKLSVTTSHCTTDAKSYIESDTSTEITVTPSTGYVMPSSVTVSGATASIDGSKITLSSVTGDVTLSITCVAE